MPENLSRSNPTTNPAAAPPPIAALISGSTRLSAQPELRAAALSWHQDALALRRTARSDARRLATPRLWPDTIGALASTGLRVASAAAPDAPLVLLLAATRAAGLPVAPPPTSRSTIARAQKVVRRGGPAYIKLGQFIATADGLLPGEWVRAFAWCRDDAPSMHPHVARAVLERELGPRTDMLADFDPEPIGTGSIGQVHAATLRDGSEVVIKLRRPRLRRRLRSDIETLAILAAGAERASEAARAAGLRAFITLFAELALEELDFRIEAANLVEATATLEALGADHVRAPRPIPGMVTERVLMMERLPGVPYTELPLAVHDIDGAQLLRSGITSVIEATLVQGIFHGDLHSGNVLVDEQGGFSMVDFGITGRLGEREREGLIRFLIAFASSDAAGQIDAMAAFGALTPGADRAALTDRLQQAVDRIDSRADGAVTFERLGETLASLLGVLAAGGMTMPKDLVLFFKNLLYLSGFAASVSPATDLFSEVQSIIQELVGREESGLAALVSRASGSSG